MVDAPKKPSMSALSPTAFAACLYLGTELTDLNRTADTVPPRCTQPRLIRRRAGLQQRSTPRPGRHDADADEAWLDGAGSGGKFVRGVGLEAGIAALKPGKEHWPSARG